MLQIGLIAIMRCNQKMLSWLFTTPNYNERNQRNTIFGIVRCFDAAIQQSSLQCTQTSQIWCVVVVIVSTIWRIN